MRMGILTGILYTEEEYLSKDDIECCVMLKDSDLEDQSVLDSIFRKAHIHCLFCSGVCAQRKKGVSAH